RLVLVRASHCDDLDLDPGLGGELICDRLLCRHPFWLHVWGPECDRARGLTTGPGVAAAAITSTATTVRARGHGEHEGQGHSSGAGDPSIEFHHSAPLRPGSEDSD